MANVFTSDKHAAAHTNQDAAKLKAENDAEHLAAANKAREDAAQLTGYVPHTKSLNECLISATTALANLQKVAETQETSNFVPLALAFADYGALRLAATGSKVSEKEVKEFFADVIKGHETGKRTIAGYVTMARKAGMLLCNYNTTTIFQAWCRVVECKLEIKRQDDKPEGKDWVRDILGDISAWRPEEKQGKGKDATFERRASRIVKLGASDISDAYAKFIVGSLMTRDGKVAPTTTPLAKGADDKNTAGQTQQVAMHDATDDQLLHAFVTMMHDKARVEAILRTEAGAMAIYNAYMELDMHVNEDGDVVLKKAA